MSASDEKNTGFDMDAPRFPVPDRSRFQEPAEYWKARYESAMRDRDSKRVPLEPTPEMLDVAVSFALNVQISRDYNWSAYMADVYRRMIAMA